MYFSVHYHSPTLIRVMYYDGLGDHRRVHFNELFSLDDNPEFVFVYVTMIPESITIDDINTMFSYVYPLFYRYYVDLDITIKDQHVRWLIDRSKRLIARTLNVNYCWGDVQHRIRTECYYVHDVNHQFDYVSIKRHLEYKREACDKLVILADKSTLPKDVVTLIKKFIF